MDTSHAGSDVCRQLRGGVHTLSQRKRGALRLRLTFHLLLLCGATGGGEQSRCSKGQIEQERAVSEPTATTAGMLSRTRHQRCHCQAHVVCCATHQSRPWPLFAAGFLLACLLHCCVGWMQRREGNQQQRSACNCKLPKKAHGRGQGGRF